MADYSPGNPGISSWEGFPCFTYVYQVPSTGMPPPLSSSDGNIMGQSQELNVQLTSPNYPNPDNYPSPLMDSPPPPLQFNSPIMFMSSEPAVNNLTICDGNPCRCYSYLNQPNYNNNTGSTVVVGVTDNQAAGITWETQQQQQQPPMATTETVMMMMSPYATNSECSESISIPSLCSPTLSDSQESDMMMSPPPTPTSTSSIFIEIPPPAPPLQNNFAPVAVPSQSYYYYYQNGMDISPPPQPPFQLLSTLPPPTTSTNYTSQFNHAAHEMEKKTEKKSLKPFNNKQQQGVVTSMIGSCEFCKSNGESVKIYRGHSLKDAYGNVTCPILFKYTCPHCNATGNKAHTIKYCPLMREKMKNFHYKKVRNSVGRLTTMKY